ncbi:MAG: hypothetical protein JO214_02330, partial [Frankiaceae bacterium]|nr:hypothetical protein [Frankiaceae bacterium]
MPEGIIATADAEGFVAIDFVDPSLRGPALKKLIDIGGPETIETLTRVGPRRQYRVPEGNAREAGLLDEATVQSARGLNTDGTPNNGGGGPDMTVGALGHTDTGAAAALKAADPNVNAGGGENWHTPTAEYTSANKYVGTTSAAAERALAPSPFTGSGASHGGSNAAETPTHREVIDYVKENSPTRAVGGVLHASVTEGRAVKEPPVQALNTGLASKAGALGSDPGGWAEQPEGDDPSVGITEAEPSASENTAVEPVSGDTSDHNDDPDAVTPPDSEDVVEYPEGEPSSDWRRDELDAYALKVKG